MKRKLEAVVISDVHLGSLVSRANELNEYLKTIDPKVLILNGDFLDMWQLRMKFVFPGHIQVIRRVLKMLKNGTRVVYLPGNHDEALRRYMPIEIGLNFMMTNEFIIETPFEKILIFHGDIFDRTVQGTGRFIGKLGTWAYNLLFAFNKSVDKLFTFFSRDGKTKPLSLARRLAQKNNRAVAKAIQFEKNVVDFAHARGFDTVIVGHSHVPMVEAFVRDNKWVRYLNSGDWTEHMTSLELDEHFEWHLHEYNGPKNLTFVKDVDVEDWNRHQDELSAGMNKKNITINTLYGENSIKLQ